MPKFFADLHLHSYHSDGDDSPSSIMKQAKRSGLKAVTLTDHNTLNGINEAKTEAKKLGLLFLEGIEVSCSYKGMDIHIIGLSKKFNRSTLVEGLKKTVQGYNERIKAMVDKLNKLNQVPQINYRELLRSKGRNPILTKYDIVRRVKKAGPLVSHRGDPAYVPYGDWAPMPIEAIKLIHKANGIAFIAHPGALERSPFPERKTSLLVNQLIPQLAKAGLDGIESRHSKHSAADEKHFKRLATKLNLISGGGSDSHGRTHHPDRKIGGAGATEQEFEAILKKMD